MYKKTSRRVGRVAITAVACALGAAATAQATPTATYSGGSLIVSGDNTNETITARDLALPSNGVSVQAAGINDADGAGTACSVSGDVLTCDTFIFSLQINGGGGDDTLTSTRNTGVTYFDGGAGNDTETGGPGYDRFMANPGADTFVGGSKSTDPNTEPYKTYVANGGEAEFFQRDYAEDELIYSSITDNVSVSMDNTANDGTAGEGDNVAADLEYVATGKGNDALTAGANGVYFAAGAGQDSLTGSPQADTLQGGGDSDTESGLGGNDSLYDGDFAPSMLPAPGDPPATPAGTDKLDGGAGDDYFDIDLGADEVIGGDGTDEVSESRLTPLNNDGTGNRSPIAMKISLNDQADDGADGEGDNVHSDVENVSTGTGDDTIVGSDKSNRLLSGNGKDNVTGGGGSDDIDTGAGDDTISAQDSVTDRVDGGKGTDSANVDLPGGQPERADVVLNVESVTGTEFAAPNPPPVPPVVNIAPVLTITTSSIKATGFTKTGTISVAITSSEPVVAVGDVTVPGTLRAVGDLTIGTGKLPLGTGKRTLKIKVAKKQLTTLKKKLKTKAQRKKGIKVKVSVTVTDAGGIAVTKTKRISIKG